MDDMVIKTRKHDEFISDREETLNSLCKFQWKLNPTKCIFGVPLSVIEELKPTRRRLLPS
jgi:hypothetical protein